MPCMLKYCWFTLHRCHLQHIILCLKLNSTAPIPAYFTCEAKQPQQQWTAFGLTAPVSVGGVGDLIETSVLPPRGLSRRFKPACCALFYFNTLRFIMFDCSIKDAVFSKKKQLRASGTSACFQRWLFLDGAPCSPVCKWDVLQKMTQPSQLMIPSACAITKANWQRSWVGDRVSLSYWWLWHLHRALTILSLRQLSERITL